MIDTFSLSALIASAFLIVSVLAAFMVLHRVPAMGQVQSFIVTLESVAFSYFRRVYQTTFILSFLGAVLLFFAIGIQGVTGFLIGTAVSLCVSYCSTVFFCKIVGRLQGGIRDTKERRFHVAFTASGILGIGVFAVSLVEIAALYHFFSEHKEVLVGAVVGHSILLFFVKMGGGVLQKVSQSHTNDTTAHRRALSFVSFLVAKSVNGSAAAVDIIQSFVLAMTGMIILESLLLVSSLDVPTVVLIIGVVAMISTTISVVIVRSGSFIGSFRAISATIIGSMVMSALLVPGAVYWLGGDIPQADLWVLYGCMMIGLVMSGLVIFTHYYYTAIQLRAMRRIIQASTMNDMSAFVRSLGIGLESVAIPALSVSIALTSGYIIGDIYGVLAVVAGFLLIIPLLLVLHLFALLAPSSMLDIDDDSSHSVAQFLENAQEASFAITKGYSFFIACIASVLLLLSIGYSVVSQEQYLIASFVVVPYFVSGVLLGCCASFLFLSGLLSLATKVSHRIIERIKTYQENRREYRIKDFSWIADATSRLVQRESLYLLFLLLAATPLVIVTLQVQAITGFVVGVIACSFLLSFSLFILGIVWNNAHHIVSSNKNGIARAQQTTIRYVASATDVFKDGVVEAMNVFMKTVVALAFLLIPFVL